MGVTMELIDAALAFGWNQGWFLLGGGAHNYFLS